MAKLSTRTISKLHSEALAIANRRAQCNIRYGFGTLAEALEEYASFVELWPRHAPYVGRIEWLKAYRAAPHWGAIRRICGIKLPR